MGLWGSAGDRSGAAPYYDPSEEQRKAEQAARKSRKLNLICLVVIIVAFLGYSLFFRQPTITAAMDDKTFALTTAENEAIAFSLTAVNSVEFGSDLSAFDRGSLQSGTETSACCSGSYRNDAFGEYQLHVNLKVNSYVIVHWTGGTLVFNTTSADATTELYTNLASAVNH